MPSELRVDKISTTSSPYDPVFSTTGGALSHRNLIINGGMTVAQRATSSNTSSGYHNVDRFRWTGGGHASLAGTIAQTAITDLAGFSKCLKHTVTTEESSISAGEYWWMHTRIEGQDLQCLSYGTSNAKTCTLSFYVRCSVAGTYAVSIMKPDSTSQQFGSTYTVSSTQASNSTAAAGWQRVSITIPANTAQGIADDNGIGFDIRWVLFAGSDYTGTNNTSWVNTANGAYAYGHSTTMGTVDNSTWEITGIQLELGSVATPFEHRSYNDEIMRCFRYYYMIANASRTSAETVGAGYMYNATYNTTAVPFKVPMRGTPTLEESGSGGYICYASGAAPNATSTAMSGWSSLQSPGPNGIALDASGVFTHSRTAGSGSRIIVQSSQKLAIQAEL